MSSNDEDASAGSVIIVRRKSDGDDGGHHGGVWKIAYADFMTAMMAFFLVMWLVNASDKKTVTQIASYFNPLRLTDRQPSKKGLEDPATSNAPATASRTATTGKDAAAPAPPAKGKPGPGASLRPGESTGEPHRPVQVTAASEALLFQDPQAILADIAARASALIDGQRQRAQPTPADGILRDPFDPAFRPLAPALPPATGIRPALKGPAPAAVDGGLQLREPERPADAQAIAGHAPSARPGGDDPGRQIEREAEARQIKTEIQTAVTRLPPNRSPRVEVTATSEGILISLTDGLDYGMFAIASAEPRPELVVALQSISRILSSRPGKIVVKGHTDARPFRSEVYDNWRLSSARAHMTYHMLIRGGIDEGRFERIEGHADRHLRNEKDPTSAQNRRIEILLREPDR